MSTERKAEGFAPEPQVGEQASRLSEEVLSRNASVVRSDRVALMQDVPKHFDGANKFEIVDQNSEGKGSHPWDSPADSTESLKVDSARRSEGLRVELNGSAPQHVYGVLDDVLKVTAAESNYIGNNIDAAGRWAVANPGKTALGTAVIAGGIVAAPLVGGAIAATEIGAGALAIGGELFLGANAGLGLGCSLAAIARGANGLVRENHLGDLLKLDYDDPNNKQAVKAAQEKVGADIFNVGVGGIAAIGINVALRGARVVEGAAAGGSEASIVSDGAAAKLVRNDSAVATVLPEQTLTPKDALNEVRTRVLALSSEARRGGDYDSYYRPLSELQKSFDRSRWYNEEPRSLAERLESTGRYWTEKYGDQKFFDYVNKRENVDRFEEVGSILLDVARRINPASDYASNWSLGLSHY